MPDITTTTKDDAVGKFISEQRTKYFKWHPIQKFAFWVFLGFIAFPFWIAPKIMSKTWRNAFIAGWIALVLLIVFSPKGSNTQSNKANDKVAVSSSQSSAQTPTSSSTSSVSSSVSDKFDVTIEPTIKTGDIYETTESNIAQVGGKIVFSYKITNNGPRDIQGINTRYDNCKLFEKGTMITGTMGGSDNGCVFGTYIISYNTEIFNIPAGQTRTINVVMKAIESGRYDFNVFFRDAKSNQLLTDGFLVKFAII